MPRTRVTRLRERQVEDRAVLDALLDSVLVGHVGLADEDGAPVVFPTAVARDGERALLHGSTGSRWMRRVAAGAPVCLSLAALEGLVVARSAFESSLRYASAAVFGTCVVLEGEEKAAGLDRLLETLLPGRASEVRPSTPAELRRTLVLALALETWSCKVADGWPEDPAADVAGSAWAGVVPVVRVTGAPLAAPDLRPGVPVPSSVSALAGRALTRPG